MKRRWWILAVIVLIIFMPVLMFLSARNSLSADLQYLKTRSVPTTFAELDAMQPKDENAGPAFEEVAKHLSSGEAADYSLIENYSEGRTPFGKNVVDAYNRLRPDIDAIRAASSKRHLFIQPVMDPTYPRRSIKPNIDQMRVMGLLTAAARTESALGNTKEAFADLKATNRVISLESQSPGFITFLNTQTFQMFQMTSWAQCLNEHQDKASISIALDVVKDPLPAPNLLWLVKSELPEVREQLHYVAEHPKEWAKDVSRYMKVDPLSLNPIAMHMAEAQIVHGFRLAIAKIQDDPAQWKSNQKLLHDIGAKVNTQWPIKRLGENSLPIYGDVCSKIGASIATQRVAKAAAMLVQYKLDHGNYPAVFPFSGSDTIDPFSGMHLHYRREKKGFTIWSIGEDQIDNGGPIAARSFEGRPDIVVTIK